MNENIIHMGLNVWDETKSVVFGTDFMDMKTIKCIQRWKSILFQPN